MVPVRFVRLKSRFGFPCLTRIQYFCFMKQQPPRVLSEKCLYDDRIRILKAELELSHTDGTTVRYERSRVEREDAAAVLLWDRERDVFVFIRQYRYPVARHQKELLMELVAGKIDEGEDPLGTAIRETEEEAGYVVPEDRIRLLCTFFASPGYTTERYFLYLAEVTASDLSQEVGGLEEENEYIERVEMSKEDFFSACREGRIHDGKTLMAGLWLMNEGIH
jgi:nudix-type nucleoside diphosphatase (YffH/AdpP family)